MRINSVIKERSGICIRCSVLERDAPCHLDEPVSTEQDECTSPTDFLNWPDRSVATNLGGPATGEVFTSFRCLKVVPRSWVQFWQPRTVECTSLAT